MISFVKSACLPCPQHVGFGGMIDFLRDLLLTDTHNSIRSARSSRDFSPTYHTAIPPHLRLFSCLPMSLGKKVHQYQTWYGEKCPYTQPVIKIAPTPPEREFIPSITKGIKTGTQKAIILGPKRERPSSAIRSAAVKAPVMPIRPISGSRVRPTRPAEVSLGQDSQFLKIRFSPVNVSFFSFYTVQL